jgi:hypothetical protein
LSSRINTATMKRNWFIAGLIAAIVLLIIANIFLPVTLPLYDWLLFNFAGAIIILTAAAIGIPCLQRRISGLIQILVCLKKLPQKPSENLKKFNFGNLLSDYVDQQKKKKGDILLIDISGLIELYRDFPNYKKASDKVELEEDLSDVPVEVCVQENSQDNVTEKSYGQSSKISSERASQINRKLRRQFYYTRFELLKELGQAHFVPKDAI